LGPGPQSVDFVLPVRLIFCKFLFDSCFSFFFGCSAQLVIGGSDDVATHRRLWLIDAVGELRLVESVTSGILLGLLHSTETPVQVCLVLSSSFIFLLIF
jgi:hypothetical protein